MVGENILISDDKDPAYSSILTDVPEGSTDVMVRLLPADSFNSAIDS